MNILFTCAGRRNYLIEFFKEALGGRGIICAADMQLSAPALSSADKAFKVPAVYDNKYIDSIFEICSEEKINVIISLNDLELPILIKAHTLFEAKGVKLLLSNELVINTCFDKWETIKFAEKIGLKTPKTYLNLNEFSKDLNLGKINFPVVVKPRWGSASIGIDFPENYEELDLSFRLLNSKLRRSILAEASRADMDNAILIQEKISGTEFGLDVLNDLQGKTRSVFVKEKLAMRAGETDKAVLRNNKDLEEVGSLIGNNLGHIGNLDCDIFYDGNSYFLIELNPRFGGGYPFTQMSGGNYPEAILSWLKGTDYDTSRFNKVYDVPFAKCDTLIKVGLD